MEINIVNQIFRLNANSALLMIDNVNSITSNDTNYEFELRIVNDAFKAGCNLETFRSLNLKNFIQLQYEDVIIANYKTPVYGYRYRKKINNDNDNLSLNRKINISQVGTKLNNTESIRYPLKMKLNIEDDLEVSTECLQLENYQRRQRISYITSIPLLRNWRIDKTLRLFSNDINDKKLTFPLDKQNVFVPVVYDLLDIEFEFIGNYSEFKKSIFKLFEFIYMSEFQTFNILYNKINDTLISKYNLNLSKIFPSVGLITNNFVHDEDISNYIYEEKYDGERMSIIKYEVNNEEYLYEYTKTSFNLIDYKYKDNEEMNKKDILFNILKSKLNIETKKETTPTNNETYITIIDSEKVFNKKDNNYIYFIFDILLYRNDNLNTKAYEERLKYGTDFIKSTRNISCYIVPFYSMKSDDRIHKWDKLLYYVNTNTYSKKYKDIPIDGIIIRNKNESFTESSVYKLKNHLMNTIDFLLKWIEEKQLFYIYLIGNVSDVVKQYVINNKYSVRHFGYSPVDKKTGINILFDSPLISNLYEFVPSLSWYVDDNIDNKYLNDDLVSKINELMSKIIKSPRDYDNKIVELSLYRKSKYTYQWLPLRIREDKQNPNGYRVGLSTIELLYCPINTKYIMNTKYNSDIDSLLYAYQFVTEKYISNCNNIIWNISNPFLINALINYTNIINLYVLSNNKLTLVNASKEVYNKEYKAKRTIFTKTKIANTDNINLECIFYENDISSSISELIKTDFNSHSIDLVIGVDIIKKNEEYLNEVLTKRGKVINIFREEESIENEEIESYTRTISEQIKEYKLEIHEKKA